MTLTIYISTYKYIIHYVHNITFLFQKNKIPKTERGNKNLNTVEAGRTNQGIELSENTNLPENRNQRNLRNDLEAQKRNRENALPINEVNTSTFVAPGKAPSKQTSGTTRTDVNVQAWNVSPSSANAQAENDIPSSQDKSLSRPTVDLVRDPNGVGLFPRIRAKAYWICL